MALSLLLMGFLLGMRHSLEADHVAAVATLATRSSGLADSLRQGAVWGLGHTLALVLVGSVVIWIDGVVPLAVARGLELAVGAMLLALGADVLWRLLRERVHFHLHGHADGCRHYHAHSHAGERAAHDPATHAHQHHDAGRFPLRALCVGLMHGMAGSAALILLTLHTVQSPWQGMAYMLLFGLGSVLGMALLSAVIALPLRRSAAGLTWMHNGLHGLVGTVSVGVGGWVVVTGW